MGSFGERVKKMREDLSLKQTDFGLLVGLSSGAMSNVESDKRQPTFEALLSICEVAIKNGIDLTWLLTGEEHSRCVDITTQETALLALFRELPDEQKAFYINSLQGAVDALHHTLAEKHEVNR